MRTERAFTLIEILTVIVIIGILVTIITAAVAAAFRAAQRGKIGMEMSQIATALERYKAEFGEYPPDMFDDDALVRHVRKRWPRLDWQRMPPEASQAESIRTAINDAYGSNGVNFTLPNSQIGALALWLGGFPNSDGKLSGFYADPENPFTPSNTFDGKTFADLEFGKNVRSKGYSVPVVGTEVRSVFVPIVYFRGKASGGTDAYDFTRQRFNFSGTDFPEFGLCVPYIAEGTAGNVVRWKNPSTYQLIHPGLDGKFSSAVNPAQVVRIVNTGIGISFEDSDNITNFSDNSELQTILP